MAEIKAVLRDTRDEDMPRVEHFYLSAPEDKREYLVLHLEDHQAALKKGFHFIVEHKGKIVAATMINPPSTEESLYAEAGNTLIVGPVEGFRLQRFFLEIRAAALAVTEPGLLLTTGVNQKNKRSYKNISETEELSPWDPPENFYGLCNRCKWKVSLELERRCCCDFFLLDSDNQRKLVRRYLDRINGRSSLVLQNKGGSKLHLLLQSRWATEDLHLRTLRAFADG